MPRADRTVTGQGLRPKLTLVAVLALAGCGATLRQCPNPAPTLSTRAAAQTLPEGCSKVQTGADGVATLACEGGRVGYAFGAFRTEAH